MIVFVLAAVGTSHCYGQFQVNASASQDSCNCFTLTDNQGYQVGSVWHTNMIDLQNPFEIDLEVFLGCFGQGADGLTFCFQQNPNAVGGVGNGMGNFGIAPSFSTVIDTYQNTADGDPIQDHLSINIDGDASHLTANNVDGPLVLNEMEDCQWHTMHVSWDPVGQYFEAIVDGTSSVSYTGDIAANFFGGNSMVYWGLTGGTGGASNEHRFCFLKEAAFTYSAIDFPICAGSQIGFVDMSTNSFLIDSYLWDFGDGSTSTAINPTHSYASGGQYNVTLQITYINGCVETTTSPVSVGAFNITASATPEAICLGDSTLLQFVVDTLPPPSFCPYTLTLTDAGLDGWSGASIEIVQNGVVTNSFTCLLDTLVTTIQLPHNGAFSIRFVGGAADAECAFHFADPQGQTLVNIPSLNGMAGNTIHSNTANCQYLPLATTFDWNPDAILSDTNSASPYATPTQDMLVWITVQDSSNSQCSATDSLTITVSPPMSLLSTATMVSCFGGNNGSATLSIVGGTAPYSFNWSGTGLGQATISGLQAGTYSVEVVDSAGCSALDTITINEQPELIVDAPFEMPSCGESNGWISLNVTSGNGPFTYLWEPPFSSTESSISDLWPGVYIVAISDSLGCTVNDTFTLSDPFNLAAAFDASSTSGVVPFNVDFDNLSTGIWDSFTWDFGDGEVELSQTNSSVNHLFTTPGEHLVTLIATDDSLCTDTARLLIEVTFDFSLYVPNSFTPDADGVNDVFLPISNDLVRNNYSLQIFTRWGEEIFVSHEPEIGWDGSFKGERCPVGVYVWKLSAKSEFSDAKDYVGRVTLVR